MLKKILNIFFLQVFLLTQMASAVRGTWLTVSAISTATAVSTYSFADAFDDAAKEGQNSGAGLLKEFGMGTTNGTMTYKNPNGTSTTEGLNQFFPSSGGVDDTATFTGATGNGPAIGNATDTVKTRLQTEASAQGDAYRTITDVVNSSSHANRKTDPVFDTAKAILDTDDPAFDMVLKGCTPVTTSPAPHVPDYQSCNNYTKKASSCQVAHEIEAPVFKVLGTGSSIKSCGTGCIDIVVGSTAETVASTGGVCAKKKTNATLQVTNTDAITTAVLTNAKYSGLVSLEIDNNKVWTGLNGEVNDVGTVPLNDPSCQSTVSQDENLNVDVTTHIKKIGTITIALAHTLNDSAYGEATIRVNFDPSAILTDKWTPDSCIDIGNSASTSFCSINTTCLVGPDSSGCITTENGKQICTTDPEYGALQPSPLSAVDKLCQLAEVTRDCDFTDGMATGWTDASGGIRAIGDGLPTISTCGAYDTSSSCAFVESECIPGAQDTGGECYGTSVVYDCGYSASPLATVTCTTDTSGNPVFDTAFTGCTTTTDTQETVTTNRIPDIKTCETIQQPEATSCTATRDLQVKAGQGNVQLATLGYYKNTFRVDLVAGSYTMISPSDSRRDVGHITPVNINDVCGPSGEGSISMSTLKVWSGGAAAIGVGFDGGWAKNILQKPTCSNGLVAIVQTVDGHTSDWETYSLEFTYTYKRVVKDEWTYENQECEDTATQILDGFCSDGAVSCPTHNQSCIVENGVSVCAPDIQISPFSGVGNACLSMEITNAGCQFNNGSLQCWTDPQGNQHCPTNESNFQDTCGVYDSDPSCVYIEEQCIEGVEGASGACYAFTRVYDCGKDVPITNIVSTTSTTCDGAIRCMGGDCVTRTSESNPDFGKAAATMAAADFMAMETSCVDNGGGASSCELFTGGGLECKKALGGYVDCCETPSGVSLQDYLSLATNTYKVANKNGAVDQLAMSFQDSVGSWTQQALGGIDSGIELAASPFNSAYESNVAQAAGQTIADFFTSSGGSTDLVTEGINTFGPSAIKKQAAQVAGDFLLDNFGADVATSLLDGAVTKTATTTTVEFSGNLATSGAGALLGAIMFAYMIYSIINILIQIIWACEEEEFELGVKRELKSCHYIGSYCADKVLGSCIEKRESYCCYASPFARIVQEQAKIQTASTFGTPKIPECGGLSVAEVETLDWDQIDLSEWVAILNETGMIPSSTDALSKYQLDATTGNTAGFNAGQEIQGLIDITDQEGAHDKARENLWGN